jgi:Predicted ferric reductase
VTGIFHFCCAYDRGGDEGQTTHSRYGPEPNIGKFAFEGEYQITGSLLFISLILLIVPSILSIFRRLSFDLWYFSHVLLAASAIVLVVIHGTANVLIALVWWVIDLSARYLLMTGRLYPREATLRVLPGDIVEISFPKTDALQYDPGQFLMIAIPEIGFSQFHPFSISSSPHQKTVTMHTKAIGGWTRKLMELAKTKSKVNILLEGPYGNLAVDINDTVRYKTVVLIAGGIGITPLLSVANDLLQQVQNGREMTRIRFVWTIRSLDVLQSMKDSGDIEGISGGGLSLLNDYQSIDALQLDVHVTGNSSGKGVSKKADAGDISTITGRPNIEQVLNETKELASKEGEGAVAVLVCGPMSMIDECRDATRRISDLFCGKGVKFDFHEEKFEL